MEIKVTKDGTIAEFKGNSISAIRLTATEAGANIEVEEPADWAKNNPFYRWQDGKLVFDQAAKDADDAIPGEPDDRITTDERLEAIESAIMEMMEVLLDG